MTSPRIGALTIVSNGNPNTAMCWVPPASLHIVAAPVPVAAS